MRVDQDPAPLLFRECADLPFTLRESLSCRTPSKFPNPDRKLSAISCERQRMFLRMLRWQVLHCDKNIHAGIGQCMANPLVWRGTKPAAERYSRSFPCPVRTREFRCRDATCAVAFNPSFHGGSPANAGTNGFGPWSERRHHRSDEGAWRRCLCGRLIAQASCIRRENSLTRSRAEPLARDRPTRAHRCARGSDARSESRRPPSSGGPGGYDLRAG